MTALLLVWAGAATITSAVLALKLRAAQRDLRYWLTRTYTDGLVYRNVL